MLEPGPAWAGRRAECEGLLEPASTLGQMAPRQPERRRRRRQRERALLVFAGQIPDPARRAVRLLGLEALTVSAASQRNVEGGVRGPNIVLLATGGSSSSANSRIVSRSLGREAGPVSAGRWTWP